MEYLVAGAGVISTPEDGQELLLAGSGVVGNEVIAGGGGVAIRVGFRAWALRRNRYLFHYAQDPTAVPPADVPDGGSGFLVVADWDGYRLARASRFYYQLHTEFAVVVEPPTRAVLSVRVPFKPFGRNPYLAHAAQDTSAPEPETSARFAIRVPFKSLGRNPYVTHAAQDTSAPAAPEPDTSTRFVVRLPFKPYARNPYVRHGSIEGVEQQPQIDDAGSNLWVVPVWDRFRLARAQGFYYRGRNDVPTQPEPDTYTRRSVRVPFKPFGHTRYILSTRRDDTIPPQESLAPHIVRQPFRPFRPNRYILSTRRDDTFTPPVEPSYEPLPARGRYQESTRYRRNPYLWRSSGDAPVVAVSDTHIHFLVRVPFRAFRRQNRQAFRYYLSQPVPVPPSGFKAGWADESTITINMRRIDRGVIA